MNYYNIISKSYNELYKEEQLNKIKIILKELNLKDKEKVLDVGCGTAFYKNLFKNYTGIDNSKGMLSKSKTKNLIYGNAENLPFKDKSFSVVICITAIHNFKDYKKSIKEMKRVCKNKIIITILKRAKKFKEISSFIEKNFNFKKIGEDKDMIYIINQTY